MRRWAWGVVLAAGCFGGGEEVEPTATPAEKPLVAPLSTAVDAPWVQRVWYTGQLGERVEGLTLTAGADSRPVVTFVNATGVRRTVRLDAEGVAAPLEHRVAGESRDAGSARSPDGALRVRVSDDGGPTLLATPMQGGAPVAWVREARGVLFRHPSFREDGGALYFDEGSARGGVYRYEVATGGLQRVVLERGGATPIGWSDASGGERIVYVEEADGVPPRVLVAAPPSAELLAAHRVVEAGLPARLLGVHRDAVGRLVRVVDCDGEGPSLALTLSEQGASLSAVPSVALAGAWSCGEGCWEWVQQRESGAFQVVSQWRRVAEHTWTVALAGDAAGAGSPGWWDASADEELIDVSGCAPALAPEAWISTTREIGQDHFRFQLIEAASDRLKITGTKRDGRQPFVLVLPHGDRSVRYQNTAKVEAVDARRAVFGDGSAAEISAGALVLTRGEERTELLPASPERKLTGVGWSPAGDRLAVADAGAQAGVWELALEAGTYTQRVRAAAPGAVAAFSWEGEPWVAWAAPVGRRAAVHVARAMNDAERAAWARGPLTLLDVMPRWVAVQLDRGGLMRCAGDPWVRIETDAAGSRVQWSERVSSAIWASVTDRDGSVRFLGVDAAGQPIVVAELRVDEELARQGQAALRWVDRLGVAELPDAAWLPADRAAELPAGSACRAP